MKRVALIAGLTVVAGLWATPAEAVTATQVVRCRSSNPTCWPTAFMFDPKGRAFYVERFTGKIRFRNLRTGRHRTWGRVRHVATGGERGALGLALDPRWRSGRRYRNTRWVYVYYTHDQPLENRILRLRKRRGGGFRRELLARIPAGTNHNGGVIRFGPDRLLYGVTGDAGNPANSQSFTNLAGKVIRMTVTGATPSNNPVLGGARRRILSYGHRNSFGFTFDLETGRLWQTENGPQCDDELNLITGGGNYGWGPGSSCPNTSTVGTSPIASKQAFTPVIAPTGAAFCKGCGLGVEGRLLFGSFNDGKIRAATLNAARDGITGVNDLFQHSRFILAMRRGRSGSVYFSDDRAVYRLDP